MMPSAKDAIRTRLKELGMTQAQLAEKIGTTPAILSRSLGGALVRQDSHWPAILDALNLQVTITPKEQ